MGSKAARKLHLKIRVILTRRMTVKQAREKLARTIRTGIVQEGIDIAWINWRRPDNASGVRKSGTYLDDDAVAALADFYAAIHDPETKTRVEVIDEG